MFSYARDCAEDVRKAKESAAERLVALDIAARHCEADARAIEYLEDRLKEANEAIIQHCMIIAQHMQCTIDEYRPTSDERPS